MAVGIMRIFIPNFPTTAPSLRFSHLFAAILLRILRSIPDFLPPRFVVPPFHRTLDP